MLKHVRKGVDHVCRVFALTGFDDKRAIKLDDVEWQFHDTFHVGVSGAEIIQIKLDPVLLQFFDPGFYDFKIRRVLTFRQFNGDLLTGDVVFMDHPQDILTEMPVIQFMHRKIHGDPVDDKVFIEKSADFPAGLIQDHQ